MSVAKSQSETYRIQNNGEWATICISGWHRPDGPSGRTNRTYCGEFMAYTSFGVFGYQWTAMGQPLKEFLLDVQWDYFCQKAYAGETTVFDFDESIKALKSKVRAVRREQRIDKDEARALYEAVESVDYSQDATEFVSACMSADIRDYAGSRCNFDEPWEFVQRVPNPQCVGFWKEIWPLFCNQLREDLMAPVKEPVTFEQAWSEYEKRGYNYGTDALEQVRFGWKIAHEYASQSK